MKLFVALFVALFSFNSHGMGAGMCKVINEWPGCPQKHKLTVINGEGGGKYLPKTEVKIKAVASNPRQVFVVWSDPDGVIKDPKAADTLLIMGDKDVTVTAEFEQGPTDPCEIDPASCEPQPSGKTRRAQFLRDNAGRSSHVFFSSKVDDDFRREYIRFSKEAGHNEIYIYANNVGDYGRKDVEYKTELKAEWRAWIKKMNDDGLSVVMWLFADDSGFGGLSDAEIERRTKLVHDDLGDMIKTYVPFLEINEAMDEARAKKTVAMVKRVTGKEVGCHTGSISSIGHCSGADVYFLQTGFGNSESEVVSLVKSAISKFGKCKVLLAEYSKSGDTKLGDAGIRAGAIGCGNGCTVKDLPKECDGGVTPEPDDFDWSKVKKYGGPEIGIASDIATWEVTSQLKSVSFSGTLLRQSRDEFKPAPCKDNLQGNFNAAVKQSDGTYIVGSWDYEKCGGQTGGKTIKNLQGEMANSFNLKKGSEICFFNSGLARSSVRNQKIRTSVKCTEWPY